MLNQDQMCFNSTNELRWKIWLRQVKDPANELGSVHDRMCKKHKIAVVHPWGDLYSFGIEKWNVSVVLSSDITGEECKEFLSNRETIPHWWKNIKTQGGQWRASFSRQPHHWGFDRRWRQRWHLKDTYLKSFKDPYGLDNKAHLFVKLKRKKTSSFHHTLLRSLPTVRFSSMKII